MEQYNNLIGHYQDSSSDKVYVSSVREKNGNWEVVGSWGRRGRNMTSQVKHKSMFRQDAYKEQNKLFAAKTKKGYEDIRSASYYGPLRVNAAWMAPYLEPEGQREEVPKPEDLDDPMSAFDENASLGDDPMFEVVCQDNIGHEAFFDKGIEYMAEKHREDQMLWVYDKFADKQEMFRERFEIVEKIVLRAVKARG